MLFENPAGCTLIDRFSMPQKLLMRIGWLTSTAVGVVSIAKHAPLWAGIYVAYVVLGFALVVLPSLCAHCPYPAKFSTCLFMPPGIVKRFYPYRGPRMSVYGKVATFTAMVGMFIMPLFWLIHDLPLLVLYGLLGLPVLAAFPAFFCRRCRHFDCPMNKTGRDRPAPAS
jgi:bacteriorhodopsin